jgi:outer membrane receptor protein involved in Fe transport
MLMTGRSKIRTIAPAVMAAAVLGFLALRSAKGQANTATFYGTVTDPSGAAVPGATVTLTERNTQAKITKNTGVTGDFAFTFVPVGVYDLTIVAQGFKTYVNSRISLGAGQQTRQTIALDVGAVTETVDVTGTAPLVNTVSAQQLHGYESIEVRELPLQNRNFSGVLKINAGVLPSQGNDSAGVDMNGVGRNGTRYSMDGTNATGNTGANDAGAYQQPNLIDVMSVEGIQEVSAVKGVIPAEYEDAVGGQVNLVSKSGTNNWHGSLFENFQSDALNARLQPLSSKARLTFNQYGGSLGGPIRKDKLFIFGDYEGYRRSENQLVQGNVPTQSVRTQLSAAVPAYKLALDAFPLPNQPVSPDATVGLFRSTKRATRSDDHVDMRGDALLTANSRISITYSRGRPFRLVPRYFIADDRTWLNTLDRGTVSYVTGGATWTSETRFGYDRTLQDRLDQFFNNNLDPANKQETFPFGRRVPDLQTSLGWGGPDGEINHSGGPYWELEQKYARHVGSHSLKIGGDFHHDTGTRNNPQIPDFFYASLADMLNNKPSQVTATLGSGDFNAHMWEFGLFAQDDWQISSKLTLNLGLRYDYYSHIVAEGAGGSPDAGLFNPGSLSMDGKFLVGPFRPRNDPFDNDVINFGPRLGFAYNPDGKGRTAIRGGFGVMFANQPPENFWIATSSAPNVPFRITFTPQDIVAFGITYPMYNDNFFGLAQQLVKNSANTNVFAIYNTHLQNPYTLQYSFDVERQLSSSMVLQSGFVATRGVKFIEWRFANRVDRITGLRPNPNLGQPYYADNSQTSSYFAWQSSFKKRFSRNLSFDLNYTWGKAIANGGGDIGTYFYGENGSRNQEFFDLKADRGPTPFDLTHYFVADWVYQSPALSGLGSRVLRRVLGEWQASGILEANTGLPVFLSQSSSRPSDRPDYAGGQAIQSGYQGTLRYLNPAAFQKVPVSSASGALIRPGNYGPGEVRAPGQWNLDFSLGKNFAVRESVRLQIRGDMFNALNHTNLSGLRTSVNDPFFGQLLSTTGARVIQLNARLRF